MAMQRKGEVMAKTISCKDMGVGECPFVARGANEAEAIKNLAEHARTVHDIKDIPVELIAKARQVMKDE
jgi:predicted small metal-binding protein